MDLDRTLAELTTLLVPDLLRLVELLWNRIDTEAPISISPGLIVGLPHMRNICTIY